jgi:hypothetical protein
MGLSMQSFSEALQGFSRKLRTPLKVHRFAGGSLVAEIELDEEQSRHLEYLAEQVSRLNSGHLVIMPSASSRALARCLQPLESMEIESGETKVSFSSNIQNQLTFEFKNIEPIETCYTGRIIRIDLIRNAFRLDVNRIFELECSPCLSYLDAIREAIGEPRTLVTVSGEARFMQSIFPTHLKVSNLQTSYCPENPVEFSELLQAQARESLSEEERQALLKELEAVR